MKILISPKNAGRQQVLIVPSRTAMAAPILHQVPVDVALAGVIAPTIAAVQALEKAAREPARPPIE